MASSVGNTCLYFTLSNHRVGNSDSYFIECARRNSFRLYNLPHVRVNTRRMNEILAGKIAACEIQ
jgi:hypothetical protein